MKKSIPLFAGAIIALGLTFTLYVAAAEKAKAAPKAAAKPSIKDVMKKVHMAPKGEDPCCKRAVDGKATKEDLALLVKCYTAMCETTAPKGDQESWKTKTVALLAAAKDLQAEKEGALDKYKAAVNCKACHEVHKPTPPAKKAAK